MNCNLPCSQMGDIALHQRYRSCVTIEKQGFLQRRLLENTSRTNYKTCVKNDKLNRFITWRVFHTNTLSREKRRRKIVENKHQALAKTFFIVYDKNLSY